MARRKAKKHVHMYHYISLGYSMAWACALPDCTHYLPPYGEGKFSARVFGKRTLCHVCRTEMPMTEECMQNDRPLCVNCEAGIEPPRLITPEAIVTNAVLRKESENLSIEEQLRLLGIEPDTLKH